MKRVRKHQIYHYTAVFEPDRKKGGYTATIPELPGCISEGSTFEDAVKNVTEAAELYLSILREQHEENLVPRKSLAIVAQVAVRA